MTLIQVLIADDHNLVRAGLRLLLENLAGVQVVAEAADGRETLQKIKAHQPDVVLMDIAMPGLNGLEVTARVSKEFPMVRVIILSMHANEEYVLRALRAGAAGYLLKDAAPAELEIAIKSAARGEIYLTPAISKPVIEGYVQRTSAQVEAGGEEVLFPFDRLTPRQREVLQLVAEGHSTKEIAQLLNVSVKTVETHRTQIMERLNIHDVAGLVRYAIRTGLVTPER
jgi:RNA polymerase sigma factor (sigma-70 family)